MSAPLRSRPTSPFSRPAEQTPTSDLGGGFWVRVQGVVRAAIARDRDRVLRRRYSLGGRWQRRRDSALGLGEWRKARHAGRAHERSRGLDVLARRTGAVSGGKDGTVRLWDLEERKAILHIDGHARDVTSVAYAADGERFVSSSTDGTVKIWDAGTGDELLVVTAHPRGCLAVAFSPDGGLFATAGRDRAIRVWDATSGQPIQLLTGHRAEVTGLAFAPDGQTLISAAADRTVRMWDASTGMETGTLTENGALKPPAPRIAPPRPVRSGACGRSATGAAIRAAGPRRGTGSYRGGTIRATVAACRPLPAGHGRRRCRRAGLGPDGAYRAESTLRSRARSHLRGRQPGRPVGPVRRGRRDGPPVGPGHRGRAVPVRRTLGEVTAVGLSPDGRTLASTSARHVRQAVGPADRARSGPP